LQQQFSLTLLGTGCPVVSTTRSGAGTLVQCDGQNFLIDIGSGVTQRLIAAGLTGADIDALLITHMHTDHLIDFYQFIISSWHQNRDRPQKVYGPPGIKKFINKTMDVWQVERDLRIKFEQRSSIEAFNIEVIEFSDESSIIETAGCTVRPVKVSHEPVKPAFGFIIEAAGKKLVLSGDTRYCENLIRAGKGADLLVHEVFVHRHMPIIGTRSKQGIKAVASYHTASHEVGKVAQQSDAKALVLTHIVPPSAERKKLIADARQDFDGLVIVGEDLMHFDLVTQTASKGGVVFSF